jgi:hypothetical protein
MTKQSTETEKEDIADTQERVLPIISRRGKRVMPQRRSWAGRASSS